MGSETIPFIFDKTLPRAKETFLIVRYDARNILPIFVFVKENSRLRVDFSFLEMKIKQLIIKLIFAPFPNNPPAFLVSS